MLYSTRMLFNTYAMHFVAHNQKMCTPGTPYINKWDPSASFTRKLHPDLVDVSSDLLKRRSRNPHASTVRREAVVDGNLVVRLTLVHPFHQRFRGLEDGPERRLVQLLHLLPYLVNHGPSLRFPITTSGLQRLETRLQFTALLRRSNPFVGAY
jgi:hypothetical protein